MHHEITIPSCVSEGGGAFIWHFKNMNKHFGVTMQSFWLSLSINYSLLLIIPLCDAACLLMLAGVLTWFTIVTGNKAVDLLVRAARHRCDVYNTFTHSKGEDSWRANNTVPWKAIVSYTDYIKIDWNCSWNNFLPSVAQVFNVYIILPLIPCSCVNFALHQRKKIVNMLPYINHEQITY